MKYYSRSNPHSRNLAPKKSNIIVIDDGSTDQTLERIREVQRSAQGHDESMTSIAGVALQSVSTVTSELKNERQACLSVTRVRWQDALRRRFRLARSHDQAECAFIRRVCRDRLQVSANGQPLDDLGRRVSAHKPIFAGPPDSIALVIARPREPGAHVAYIVPMNTYHAYNPTGGSGFYGDPIHRTRPFTRVSLLRPGGGPGAQLGEPTDPYDPRAPRQQFTHWDAKFIRWLLAEGIACDFYTDHDLHRGTDLDLTKYRCMLSVGHHEYWSTEMRERVSQFIAKGGHLAMFSGNSCYRPVDFGDAPIDGDYTIMNRLAQWPGHDESNLIGLSYGYGGGKYGVWKRLRSGWIRRDREAVGFTVRQADHWVFEGTNLRDGQTFGAQDRLVSYEVDGVPEQSNGFVTLADTVKLTGWEIGGAGAMGVFQPHAEGGTVSWRRDGLGACAHRQIRAQSRNRRSNHAQRATQIHRSVTEDHDARRTLLTEETETDKALLDSAAA